MKKSLFFTSLIAIAFVSVSNAAVVHFNDFDTEAAAGLGIAPSNMEFTNGGGDHVGASALGISDTNPRSGTYSYVIDNDTADNGNGWGGTWTGASSGGGTPGTNVTSAADAMANGTSANPLSYVDVAEGSTFTVSTWVATDATNPLSGTSVFTNVRLEFKNAAGTELFRNDNGAALSASDLSTTYQQITHSYTLTAADIAAGVESVTAVFGSDGHGFGNGDGLIYADDFSFEVDEASFITVPEPGATALVVLGMLGVMVRRRR